MRDEPASSTCTEISKLGLDEPASERWRERRRCEEEGDGGGIGERERGWMEAPGDGTKRSVRIECKTQNKKCPNN